MNVSLSNDYIRLLDKAPLMSAINTLVDLPHCHRHTVLINNRLPVFDNGGKMVGILAISAITRALNHEANQSTSPELDKTLSDLPEVPSFLSSS